MSSHSDSHDRPPMHDHGPSGTLWGHPKGLFLLFLVEMWERFSYYGMRGLLVLYLTAAIAAHQLASGTYTNTLVIEQDNANKPALRVPLSVMVGGGAPTDLPVSGDAGPLQFRRVIEKKDSTGNTVRNADGVVQWEPAPGGLERITFAATEGARSAGEPIHLMVVNPTEKEIGLKARIDRPYEGQSVRPEGAADDAQDPNYKVYFKVNDGTSVLSTKVQPESSLKPDSQRFVLSIDINRTDSGRSWIKADANVLYGWYTGMAYLLPIVGGLIADRLIGTHRSMIVGGLLIALGHIVLGISGFGQMALNDTGMTVFVMGLALITIGTGHFKPSVSVMVGQLYPINDPRREAAFSIFYMGINLGAFTCNLVCGWLAANYGWHYGFGAAAVGMIAGISLYTMFKSRYLAGIGEPNRGTGSSAPMFLPVGIVLAAIVGGLYHVGVLDAFDAIVSHPAAYGIIAAAAVVGAIVFIAKQLPQDRGPVVTIFVYMLFNALFWLSFEQAGASLNTFTDERTDRHFMGGTIPTPYFQSINPLLIILLAPIFGVFWAALARRKTFIAQPYKIGIGLIFVGLGYVVMVMAAQKLNLGIPKVTMMYIVGCYFLHTVGEIILSPTGLSYVAKTAPKNHVSSLMGIWFISSFIAGLAAGKVGALVDPIIEGHVKLPWNLGGQADFFLLFVVTSCGAGVVILAIAPLLTRLQRDRGH
jgi:proton-dependent oligopeptide transporter, POT family